MRGKTVHRNVFWAKRKFIVTVIMMCVAAVTAAVPQTHASQNFHGMTISDDGLTISGTCQTIAEHARKDYYNGLTTYYHATVIMPDGARLPGMCYETFIGKADNLRYPEPGSGTYGFKATRQNTSEPFTVIADTSAAKTTAPGHVEPGQLGEDGIMYSTYQRTIA